VKIFALFSSYWIDNLTKITRLTVFYILSGQKI
jgi:hypothetical protein